MQETSSYLYDSPILPLYHSIMLWCVRCSQFVLYAYFFTEIVESFKSIFSAIICPYNLYNDTTLVSTKALYFQNTSTISNLKFRKKNPTISGIIIYKNNIVLIALQRWCSLKSSNISVYKLQLVWCFPCKFMWERKPGLFSILIGYIGRTILLQVR